MILRLALIGVLTVGVLACATPPEESATSGPAAAPAGNPALASGEHLWTAADGVELPYEVHGDGDVTVVLVHCWMCDRTFWGEQVPVLAESYRTISLDLPGHGEAGRNRAEWTISGYGEDVAGLLRDLDLEDVVLVGHSMGGPVSLRAAALAGERVRGIVAVDTLHDAEFDFSSEQVQQYVAAFEADYPKTCGEFVGQMFPEEGVEAIRAEVERRGCAPSQASVGVALMKDFGNVDMKAWFSGAGVPIRAVNASGPNQTRTEVNRRYADFDVVFMDGVGHYPHMTRPAQFNPLLLQAIERILQETS